MNGGRDRPLLEWVVRALSWALGTDAEWAIGDLEERERTRRARRAAGPWRLVRDVGSTLGWGLTRRIRRGWKMGMDIWWDELSLAARSLMRRPGYTAGVVVTLGLGIGTVAAAFTVVDGVVLRPLPFPDSERLARLYRTDDRGASDLDFSAAQAEALSRTAAAGAGIGAFSRAGRILRPGDYADAQPRSVGFARVTDGFLETLGVSPRFGRLFDPAELRDGAPVVVLSEELWHSVFEADPSVLGSAVYLDEALHTIVGVLPAGSGFPEDALLWRPLTPDERTDDDPELVMIARLPDGVSLAAFEDVLNGAADVAAADVPGSGIRALPLRDAVLGESLPRALIVLLVASALVLLVAFTNAAGLQVLRAMEARGDASVRMALGASVPRVVRGLLFECLLLAGGGLTLGLAMAAGALPALRALAPGAVPRLASVELDVRVAAAVGVVALVGALAGGLAPALSVARRSVAGIRWGGGIVSGALRLRTLRTLVAVQLGLTTVLVISAGLLSASLQRLLEVPRGFDAEHLLAVPLAMSSATGSLRSFQQELLEGSRRIPGVTEAAVGIGLPGLGTGMKLEMIGVADLPITPGESRPGYLQTVSPSFFATARLPILEGRPLPAGRSEGAGAAVVNRAFARAFLGPEPGVGQRFTRSGSGGEGRQVMRVVGVSADVIAAPGERPPPVLYVSTEAVPIYKNLLVRLDPAAPADLTVRRVHEEILALDPEQPVNVTEWMTDVLGEYGARTRFHARLMTLFGALALSLAAVGVYGVAAYGASQRRAELGLRRALGARRGGVLALVLGRAVGTSLLGIACGAVGAWVLSRLLQTLLFEISPFDPVIYLAGAAGLGAVAVLAGLVPALRAARDEDGLSRLLREG
ncbi:MAG TPA: ABC transporter permease [Longimicrobiales bacterium]|nr:ABC transporter permease [Longimicrobiales bacterium]